LEDYEQQLLDGWEDVFKKGQLTLWIMLALKDGPKYMEEIKTFILSSTHGNLIADDQSMYRALRRYKDVEMVKYQTSPGQKGPDRKVYKLTTVGLNVLNAFVHNNITEVFYQPHIEALIRK
jgi:PadR family transcriptional regulator, regulatory protein PadR